MHEKKNLTHELAVVVFFTWDSEILIVWCSRRCIHRPYDPSACVHVERDESSPEKTTWIPQRLWYECALPPGKDNVVEYSLSRLSMVV